MTIKEEQKDERVKKRINIGLDEPHPEVVLGKR